MCVVYQNKLEADGKDIKYENKIIVIGKKMGKYLTHVKLGMIFISIKVTGKKSLGKKLSKKHRKKLREKENGGK